MLTKEEYLANGYKILELALMSPVGKLYLTIPELRLLDANFYFIVYCLVSIVLFLVGIIVFFNGYDIVYKKENK